MVTMAEVAAEAGVSVSTVSHVLNRTRPVSDALAERVAQAVASTRYSPNAVARSLAMSSTRLIGVVMSATSNPFFAPVFSAIEDTARRHGYTVLLADSHEDARREASQVRVMLDHRVAGIVLAASTSDPAFVLDLLVERQIPTTLVDRFSDDRFDQVGTYNVEPTALLVTHLAGLGHERISFIGGRHGLPTSTERLDGYRLGMKRSGLRIDTRLVRSGGSMEDRARAVVHELFAGPVPPTAFVSANNEMTLGLLRALRELSLRVPDDVAVVAFDDVAWGDLIVPALTVMAQPIVEIARSAITVLLHRIKHPGGPPQQQRIEPIFVHRQSCGHHAPIEGSILEDLTIAADAGPGLPGPGTIAGLGRRETLRPARTPRSSAEVG